jgi:glycosyltransferase involved in cell wall biosynthesis
MSSKKKIVAFMDHPLSLSGVGTQGRFLINGLLATGKYTFRVFGGAVTHQDYRLVKITDDFLIRPINGFGDQSVIRQMLLTEQPDCVLLFTDPRFFMHIFTAHDEVHQLCPLAYWNLWDENPVPTFNKSIYECVDLLNCINYPTYKFVSDWFPEKTHYVPHAVPADVYFKQPEEMTKEWKRKLLGDARKDWFTTVFVGRNARRKQPNDVIYAWKMFLDDLEKNFGHRNAMLLMHTNPFDQEGPNLLATVEMLKLQNNVLFSKDHVKFEDMNMLYNASDVLINASCAEGFGLPVLEMKMAEGLVIALKTGGLTRQVEDHETGEQYGVAIEPEIRNLVGTQAVPWIFEAFASHRTIADAYMKVFTMPKEERLALGKRAREHSLKNYDISQMIKSWDDTLSGLMNTWNKNENRRWRQVEL